MVEPRFKVGDVVKHRGKPATVKSVVVDGAYTRFIVTHSGFDWSVPASALTSPAPRPAAVKIGK